MYPACNPQNTVFCTYPVYSGTSLSVFGRGYSKRAASLPLQAVRNEVGFCERQYTLGAIRQGHRRSTCCCSQPANAGAASQLEDLLSREVGFNEQRSRSGAVLSSASPLDTTTGCLPTRPASVVQWKRAAATPAVRRSSQRQSSSTPARPCGDRRLVLGHPAGFCSTARCRLTAELLKRDSALDCPFWFWYLEPHNQGGFRVQRAVWSLTL